MLSKSYQAQVLDDGHLSLSEEIRKQFNLKNGDTVEVTISKSDLGTPLDPENPLVKLVGICKEGEKTDIALDHDKYLYHEDAP